MTAILNVTGGLTDEFIAALNQNFAAIDAALDELLGRWQIKTATFAAVAHFRYDVDTTDATITATLPAPEALEVGDDFTFSDFGGAWSTNNLTIDGNGTKIDLSAFGLGLVDRLICDATASFAVKFNGTNFIVR